MFSLLHITGILVRLEDDASHAVGLVAESRRVRWRCARARRRGTFGGGRESYEAVIRRRQIGHTKVFFAVSKHTAILEGAWNTHGHISAHLGLVLGEVDGAVVSKWGVQC